jgi:hypothetical protein
VYDVDFPNVCLSQAWYDSGSRCLNIITDAGLPSAAGGSTTFRVANMDAAHYRVTVDGQRSSDWRIVDGELEIRTVIGEHQIQVEHEKPVA